MDRRVPERHALVMPQTGDIVSRQRMGHDPLLCSGSESGLTHMTVAPADFFHPTVEPLDYARRRG